MTAQNKMLNEMMIKAPPLAAPVGYKHTEVGIIPDDWEVKQLGTLVEICSGDSPSKYKFYTTGIPYFKVEQLNNDRVYAAITPYFIHTAKTVPAGSLIFPKRGASILSNKIRVLKQDSYMDTNLMTLTCHSELDNIYLYNQLSFIGLDSVADTTSIPQINNKHITPYLIPFPTKKEQIAIADALSNADELITALEQLITKKQVIKTTAMRQLLTGRTRLPQFSRHPNGTTKGYKTSEVGQIPEDWNTESIYELVDKQKAKFDDGDWVESEHITDKGIRLIQTGNIGVGQFIDKESKKYISEASFEQLRCKEIQIGDLLICRLAEPAGRACIFPDISEQKVITSVDVTIFRPDNNRANRQFLSQYFSSSEWFKNVHEQVGGTTHKRISRGALGKIIVPYPTLKEQTAIATILSDMDAELTALERKLAKIRDIKQGMMQQLLTGRIRLPLDRQA